jgi:phosphoadenosine phosphosulfate reductase
MQSCLECCAINVWIPLHQGIKDIGVSKVIKGQRRDDRRKSTAKDGQIIDGITYSMPIEGWTEKQVFDYLAQVGADMPPGYAEGETTSRSCWNCTGFLDDSRKRIHNLPDSKREEMLRRLAIIDKSIDDQRVRYG